MVVLSASGITLSYGAKEVLREVNFSLSEGDRLGIIGVNGAGKTSLFRVLLSQLSPDAGQVYLASDKTVGYLAQDTALTAAEAEESPLSVMIHAFPGLLALEEQIAEDEATLAATPATDTATLTRLAARLEEAHRRYREGGGPEMRGRCRGFLLRMGFTDEEMGRPIKSLSGGQNTRLVLCRLLATEPDLLFLDEPTNHLDASALAWLEEFLASYRKTVLVISHDRYFLDRVTNKTLKISHTHARLYPGNYSKYRLLEAEEEASRSKQYKEQQKVIARIEANIAFQRKCGREHNFVTIRSKQKQLDRMERVAEAEAPQKQIRMAFQSRDSAGDVLTVRDLCFSYGTRPLLEGVGFAVKKGERLLLLGDNGCGKSTMIKLLCGALSPSRGRLDFGYNIEIGYYDQENRLFSEQNTVLSELADSYPTLTNGELRAALARFLFGAEDVEKTVSDLSGGERARLTLCKLMLKRVNLLLLDEPTNHLDIGSREALEEALADFDGTIIAVSHDRYFIDRLATRILEFTPGGLRDYPLAESENPYATYLALREAHAAAPAPTPEKESGREDYEAKKRERAEERLAQRRLESDKKRAAAIEARLEAIEAELFGDAASDYTRAAALDSEKTALEEELLALYERIL